LEAGVSAGADFNSVDNIFAFSKPIPNKLTLSFAPSTGLLTGTFVPAPGKTATSFKAVWLPSQTSAAGYFIGTNETGSVTVSVP
jgi:hypothetical protein